MTECCFDDNAAFSFFYDVFRGTVNAYVEGDVQPAPASSQCVVLRHFKLLVTHPLPTSCCPAHEGLVMARVGPLYHIPLHVAPVHASIPPVGRCRYPRRPRDTAGPWDCEVVLHISGNELCMSAAVAGAPLRRQEGRWTIPAPFRVFVCPYNKGSNCLMDVLRDGEG